MAGPHRLVSLTRQKISTALAGLPVEEPILLAVSGGADSMTLAAATAFECLNKKHARGRRVISLTVDHAIRPESAQEASVVVERLCRLGIEAYSQRVELGSGSGPEGDAREARYRAIADFARKITPRKPATVLLGHNANDQAETVLLGLSRGAGARSMAGMPQSGVLPTSDDVPFIRPFLTISAEDLRTTCRELGIEYVNDPSNALDGPWTAADGTPLRRSAVRHQVIPALEQAFGRDVVGALERTGRMLRDDDEALTAIAAAVFSELRSQDFSHIARPDAMLILSCEQLKHHPRAVRTRVLRLAYSACGGPGGDLVYWHLDALDKLIVGRDNKVGIDLPGMKAWREYDTLAFLSALHY
ncbi:tRNA(Ile)-lysidine synthase [Arcanobacterium pluranimalium]|uniref:tRNA lysidine(34) synthetase TilS n=1 Tax=Arcanobacterium pluranimalium TaxID=108028 RepID=UPI00195E4ADA|nr:tRNA lysidine(34) synthetase TilS [Arcanobacterium pluranimalium]MBM7825940.1 tRNA(Ile)-lysidine synthase [Arcanobacterium pluranimalium]